MGNETNNNTNEVNQKNEAFENGQPGAVMTDNETFYPEQPQTFENNADIDEPASTSEETTNILLGVVSNCKQLNIRREAQKRADNVLCIVSAEDVLTIEKDRSTNAWFYVTTADGVSGYCMKEFVAVEQ